MKNSSKLLTAVSAVALLALSSAPAIAAPGTKVGETITNTVTVDFEVGNVPQNATTATDEVAVDRKVNVTVAQLGTATTSVSPGQTEAATTFQITNLTNDIVDFDLTVTQLAGVVSANDANANDNFDVLDTGAFPITVYLDANGNNTFDPADTLLTGGTDGYLDEIAAEAEAGSIVVVHVVAVIPNDRVTGDIAVVSLEADAHAGSDGVTGSLGAELEDTAGENNAATVDTVLADGSGSDDGDNDGAFSARDDYTVAAAALTATKASRIISDPVNGVSVNAKAIPGAVIEYCIIVSNAAGSATATDVAVSDPLPTGTTFVDNSVRINGDPDGAGYCNVGTGTAVTSSGLTTVSATLVDLTAGNDATLVFRATID